jgi:succinoglycan biosynthesis transport protein ExoP
MELRQYLSVLWKWGWMIVLSVGIAAGLSYVFTSRLPRVYQTSAKLLIGQSIQSPNPNAQDIQTSQDLASTYIQIAKTTPVLQSAIDALGLNLTPVALKERFSVGLIPGTQLIELRVDDTDPARAQAIANELAHQLTLQMPAAQQSASQRDFVEKQVDELQRKIEDGQKTIRELENSIQVSSSAREIAAQRQQISTVESQIDQWQQRYTAMLAYLAPRSSNYLSIIETAQLPTQPYAPNTPLNVILAAVVGLILSLSAAIAIEYLDDTLKHPDDITRVLQLPTLGTLAKLNGNTESPVDASAVSDWTDRESHSTNPEALSLSTVPGGNGESGAPVSVDAKLVSALSPRSSEVEAYRVLRTNIQFLGIDKPIKTILVTSSNSGEGKSLVAANLAVVMAQAGSRTILVDTDLRRPTQHYLFGFANDIGLTDSLMSLPDVSELLHSTQIANLEILTSGPLPPNPAELLASERMRTLKARLEAEADIVIFDSPPLLPVTDAALLAHLVDGVVFVVDVAHTRQKDALRAKGILDRASARIFGVVLNRVIPSGSDYYYYHHYSRSTSGSRRKHNHTSTRKSMLGR